MAETFFNRLSQFMNEISRELGGAKPLAENMAAVLHPSRQPLTRRQITKICDGRDLPLRGAQLQGLNEYFQLRWSKSLPLLWSNRTVLDDVAAAKQVAFVIGSQPDKTARRIDMSRWDVRAMRETLNQLNALGQPMNILIEDVIFRGRRAEMFASSDVPENEQWFHLLGEEVGHAVVCLGSPKANHCAEVMLARMLGVKPFEPWPAGRPRPFAFIWPRGDERSDDIRSCVRMDPIADAAAIQKLDGCTPKLFHALKDVKRHTLAVAIEGQLYEVCRRQREWYTYAIIAAWRPAKRTHVCIAGLTGPATLGAAKLLPKFAPQLELGRMAWMVVRTKVTDQKSGGYRSDERRVGDSEVIGSVQYVQ